MIGKTQIKQFLNKLVLLTSKCVIGKVIVDDVITKKVVLTTANQAKAEQYKDFFQALLFLSDADEDIDLETDLSSRDKDNLSKWITVRNNDNN